MPVSLHAAWASHRLTLPHGAVEWDSPVGDRPKSGWDPAGLLLDPVPGGQAPSSSGAPLPR
jgi:hypothetical protein